MAKVRCTPDLRGKTVNVPHVEHRVSEDVKGQELNSVTFNEAGYADVSERMRDALKQFYPNQIL